MSRGDGVGTDAKGATMSALAMVIGVILCFAAYGTGTTVDGTHNIGLMQNQMMMLHTGLALTIAAVIRIPRTHDKVRIITEGEEQLVKAPLNSRAIAGIVVASVLAIVLAYIIFK